MSDGPELILYGTAVAICAVALLLALTAAGVVDPMPPEMTAEPASENISSVEYRQVATQHSMTVETTDSFSADYIVVMADGEQATAARRVTGQATYSIEWERTTSPTQLLLVNGGEIHDGKHSGGEIVERVALDFDQ